MTEKPTTDDSDRATLREAANDLTHGLIEQLRDILNHTTLENLKGAREGSQTALNVMAAAAVLRTVHGYAYTASRRLRRVASLMQLGEGEGDKPEYLLLCDREGPCCDCEVMCKHRPKGLYCADVTGP